MKFPLSLLLLASLCISPLVEVSETRAAVFSGQLLDIDSTALPYATVYLPELRQGAMTNAEGKWTIDAPEGNYRVEYSLIGYETQHEEITLQAAQPCYRQIFLKENAIRLAEVIVTDKGNNPAIAILRKVIATNKAMEKRIASMQTQANYQSSYDLSGMPVAMRRAIKVLLFLTPWRRTFNTITDHPILSVTLSRNVSYKGTKDKKTDPVLVSSSEKLTAKEVYSLRKFLNNTIYDYYEYANKVIGKKDKELDKWSLVGTYEAEGKTIDVLERTFELDKKHYSKRMAMDSSFVADLQYKYRAQLHVVEGDWAMYRIKHMMFQMSFEELAPHTWLPVTSLINVDLRREFANAGLDSTLIQKQDSLAELETHEDLTRRQRKKIDKQQEKLLKSLKAATMWVKTATSITYNDISLKIAKDNE